MGYEDLILAILKRAKLDGSSMWCDFQWTEIYHKAKHHNRYDTNEVIEWIAEYIKT